LTEPDQKGKDPEPADNWANVLIMILMRPDRKLHWEEDPDGNLEEEWEEAKEDTWAGMPGKIEARKAHKQFIITRYD